MDVSFTYKILPEELNYSSYWGVFWRGQILHKGKQDGNVGLIRPEIFNFSQFSQV